MKKRINQIVESCRECPWLRKITRPYDTHYYCFISDRDTSIDVRKSYRYPEEGVATSCTLEDA